MKLREIIVQPQQRLDEINLKQAIAAGLIATAPLAPHAKAGQVDIEWSDPHGRPGIHQTIPAEQTKQEKLARVVAKRYRIDYRFAKTVVDLAYKYQKPSFPRAKDIIAVIGIESSFNPWQVSKLKTDPAKGLMQVRPEHWKIEPQKLESVENQIAAGSAILHKYFVKLKDKHSALAAYNVGLSSFLQGEYNPRYLTRYFEELKYYEHI